MVNNRVPYYNNYVHQHVKDKGSKYMLKSKNYTSFNYITYSLLTFNFDINRNCRRFL